LWAVCGTCERWNLSPLETRWEAIEDAERVFRATPLKVSGENIGLAQTNEGLELVRVGKPPKIELMAWRYGDQFGRRRRRHLLVGGGIAAAAVGFGALSFATSSLPGIIALAIAAVQGNSLRSAGNTMRRRWGPKWTYVADDDNRALQLNVDDMRGSTIVPHAAGGWSLAVIHRTWRGEPGKGSQVHAMTQLHGEAAARALSRFLPFTNRDGGGRQHIRRAVAAIGASRDFEALVHGSLYDLQPGKQHLGVLPPSTRLALEMALHDEDERRAMAGELDALEARWKEADALASIADSLLVPEEIERELGRMKNEKGDEPRARSHGSEGE
jgi:hypothetical protein